MIKQIISGHANKPLASVDPDKIILECQSQERRYAQSEQTAVIHLRTDNPPEEVHSVLPTCSIAALKKRNGVSQLMPSPSVGVLGIGEIIVVFAPHGNGVRETPA